MKCFFICKIFIHVHACVCVCVYARVLACLYGCHTHEGICRDQKAQISLNWSKPPMRVQGPELRSSERAANILNYVSLLQVLLVYFVFCSFETRSP